LVADFGGMGTVWDDGCVLWCVVVRGGTDGHGKNYRILMLVRKGKKVHLGEMHFLVLLDLVH
jgi:hypothetical protein